MFALIRRLSPETDALQSQLQQLQQKLSQMEVQKMIDDNQKLIDSTRVRSHGVSGTWEEDKGMVQGKVDDWLSRIDKNLSDTINKRLDNVGQQITAYIVEGLKHVGIVLLDVSSVVAIGCFVFFAYGVMAGPTETKSKALSRLYLSAIAMFVLRILAVLL